MKSDSERILLYFGCVGKRGHYMWKDETTSGRPLQFLVEIPDLSDVLAHSIERRIDGEFAPSITLTESIYQECLLWPVRIVGWHDRSVDNRINSNSALVGYGYDTGDQMLDDAAYLFPSVIARQPRPTNLFDMIPD